MGPSHPQSLSFGLSAPNPRLPEPQPQLQLQLQLQGGEGPSHRVAVPFSLRSQDYSTMSAQEIVQLELSKTEVSQNPHIRSRITQLAKTANLPIEEATAILQLRSQTNSSELCKAIAQMPAKNIYLISRTLKSYTDREAFLQRSDIKSRFYQLAGDPNLAIEDAMTLFQLKPKVTGDGIFNAINQMTVKNIADAEKGIPRSGSEHYMSRSILGRPEIILRLEELANGDLTTDDAVSLLSLRPQAAGTGIRNAIAQMSAKDINCLELVQKPRFSNDTIIGSDLQSRLDQLAMAPNLSIKDAKIILGLKPEVTGLGISNRIAQMSAEDIRSIGSQYNQRNFSDRLLKNPNVISRLNQLAMAPDLTDQDVEALLRVDSRITGKGISDTIAQMATKFFLNLRELYGVNISMTFKKNIKIFRKHGALLT